MRLATPVASSRSRKFGDGYRGMSTVVVGPRRARTAVSMWSRCSCDTVT